MLPWKDKRAAVLQAEIGSNWHVCNHFVDPEKEGRKWEELKLGRIQVAGFNCRRIVSVKYKSKSALRERQGNLLMCIPGRKNTLPNLNGPGI